MIIYKTQCGCAGAAMILMYFKCTICIKLHMSMISSNRLHVLFSYEKFGEENSLTVLALRLTLEFFILARAADTSTIVYTIFSPNTVFF